MTIGIICEYNPFHNGHIYHLNKIKELYPDALIILVMSPSFTMRGEVSLLNKWDKTEIAINYGVDLVIELPSFYATNSADIFSEGAIKILNELNCDYLVFGSESNDINKLYNLANTQINNSNYDKLVKEYMDKGNNYPTSMSKALKELCNETINEPNDLLGLSYIKQIILQNSKIIPITIQRTNNYHDTELNNNITSASSIRNALINNIDIKPFVPKETYQKIIKFDDKQFYNLLKYQILCQKDNLKDFLDVDEGLDNLIIKNINKCQTYQELIENIKTKRYTYNRLNRMFIHILTNTKKKDVKKLKKIDYIRVLGFNTKGRNYLKKRKKENVIPIITNYKDIKSPLLDYELKVTKIYNLIIKDENLDIKELKSIPYIK